MLKKQKEKKLFFKARDKYEVLNLKKTIIISEHKKYFI